MAKGCQLTLDLNCLKLSRHQKEPDQYSRMPRAPRISAQKLIRVLKKLGFSEHAERGTSHLVFSHPDGRRTLVSRHRGDIKKGTLAGILRDIKVSSEQFRRLI